jgi:hypothetical protein
MGETGVPVWFHALAALWTATMLLLGWWTPERYGALLEEDRMVEWSTVGLFAAAGAVGLRNAVRQRRVFDGLVALFCLFVAGEEFSWGQRLFGFDSPEFFLANNFQQEMTLHNLPQAVVKPKWILMLVLAAYGIALPLVARARWPWKLMTALGATAPPTQLLPWFAAAIALLVWYPFTLTGEWVEFLGGALFLASMRPPRRTLVTGLALAVVLGLVMTEAVDALETNRENDRVPCATAQTQALVDDIILGGAATKQLWQRSALHKRVWTAIGEGYLHEERLSEFRRVRCHGAAARNLDIRLKYIVDPWGSPYWLSITEIDDQERLIDVYSFGANRRRDNEEDTLSSSTTADVRASGVLRQVAEKASNLR